MRFADPYLLLLLLLLPLLFYRSGRRLSAAVPAIAFPNVQILKTLPVTRSARLHAVLPWLRLLALALAVLALARPQWGIQATKIFRQGIAIAVVVDISGSMAAQDLAIEEEQNNRLDVVKQTLLNFVRGDEDDRVMENNEHVPAADVPAKLAGRQGDLIGMFTFARYTDALSPLTLDHAALLKLLEQVDIVAMAEEDGTAIGDAIVTGIEGLRRAGGASKVMIVLTDGSNNAGDTPPLQAAQIAKALNIKIYTIGTGSRGVAMMPVRRADGSSYQLPTQVYIDEDNLTQVAELTGGRYFRATDSAALRSIYSEIDRLEKAENVVESFQEYIEGFPLFLLLALALLLLEALLANTYLRTLP
jgi:Ca-activated chloride channel family protein